MTPTGKNIITYHLCWRNCSNITDIVAQYAIVVTNKALYNRNIIIVVDGNWIHKKVIYLYFTWHFYTVHVKDLNTSSTDYITIIIIISKGRFAIMISSS